MANELLRAKAPKPSAAATALYERLSKSINPAYSRLILKAADALRADITDDAPILEELRSNRATAKLAEADLQALLFLVMMEAARDAQRDLQSIMEDIAHTAGQKQSLRRRLAGQQELNARTIRGYRSPEAIPETELSELESLRLQLAMDRMAKLMSTLSNLVKKVSGTAEAVARNLK